MTIALGVKKSGRTNKARRFIGGGPRPDNLKHKQEEAKERAEAWQKLSPVQQLKELDRRFGEGKGAGKQRARILSGIERAKNRPVPAAQKAPETLSNEGTERLKAKDRRAQERQERPSK